ncbi:hypothetical protein BCIN_05g05290 [Botrytis cinerea B05.10]|uniref:NmrA-like domain-containing protein n=3 Tax=Botryotinia fuckeliana TaxID=40559 RepID=A0A384JIH8_BOTFB|nr:hypothetical protein BCIN_05g05290 [Botrytis cinerea B05.10]XP_024548855.1 hypothetical protein BCIN_05g05290 [Botrytis cinerea B05.10]EMR85887.1 putative -like family protein [Botrytis cinerea BcDW1]CCD53582.1 similar to nmrA family transcriptional regulator [Botrytis cinerea T4]ATZ50154.1 hypothetical protein BCIN_05g05290 [Botrytis cinerea B05.10]ATZ50155.1 hypothetical protein BCIN_05g05290 [Botrytis cinerea B05.10]
MSSSAKKLLVVFGATGAQGGSVVQSILSDATLKKSWAVRGITRDVTKPAAKKIEALGAETFAADLNDTKSLKAALKGAYAVFAVTNFWESQSADVEKKQGIAIADAAKEAGVQHFIWSSLLNITKLSNGVLPKVTHFDSKADIEEYVRKIGIPATFYLAGFYMSNIPGQMLQKLPPDNKWKLAFPIPASASVPLLAAAEDTGKFVKGILLNREKVLGKRIYGATKYYTLTEVLKEFTEQYPAASEGADNVELPHEVYKNILKGFGMSDDAQEELLQNMRLLSEFGYYGGDSLDESHSILVDKLTTWKEFIAENPAFAELK